MAKRYNNYQYETSPRKLEPIRSKPKKKQTQIKKTNETKKVKKPVKQNVTNAKMERVTRRHAVLYVMALFIVLLVISYRNSQITEQFSEVKSLKNNLAAIQKENEQLEVSIESSINLSKIEQEAINQLGMQKLDNSKKIYVSLPKKDYVEPATEDVVKKDNNTNWFEKVINMFLGK